MKYILFNKPYGVLSQFTDEATGHATLADYIPIPDVYPAGRLDRDSEGLLLLTNDGPLIHRLTHPSRHIEKIYWVQIEGSPEEAALEKLQQGVEIKGYQTLPCKARVIPEPELPEREKPVTPHGPTSWLAIMLREGKKRQIRHMTAAIGLPTLRLVRVAIGPLEVGDLKPGEWRNLYPGEMYALRQALPEIRKREKLKRRKKSHRRRG